ncbi:hypothetical protein EJB05_09328, partial [Eragrostis curvula]
MAPKKPPCLAGDPPDRDRTVDAIAGAGVEQTVKTAEVPTARTSASALEEEQVAEHTVQMVNQNSKGGLYQRPASSTSTGKRMIPYKGHGEEEPVEDGWMGEEEEDAEDDDEEDVETFDVTYELLPHVCFNCGCMGHGDRECQNAKHKFKGYTYSEALRASPFKKTENRKKTVAAMSNPAVARGLFYDNPLMQQRTRMRQESGGAWRRGHSAADEESRGSHDGRENEAHAEVPEVNSELAAGVANMQVDKTLILAALDPTERTLLGNNHAGHATKSEDKKQLATSSSSQKHDSDRNWKNAKKLSRSEADAATTVPVKQAIANFNRALVLAASCKAAGQGDVQMPPVSPLGKRGAAHDVTQSPAIGDDVEASDHPVLLTALWKNWNVRNDLTHGGPAFCVDGAVAAIETMLDNWENRHLKADDPKGKRVKGMAA